LINQTEVGTGEPAGTVGSVVKVQNVKVAVDGPHEKPFAAVKKNAPLNLPDTQLNCPFEICCQPSNPLLQLGALNWLP